MTDGTTRIPLSVVISTVNEPCSVIATIQDLRRQVRALDGQLIVISKAAPGSAPPPDVCVHQVPGGSVFDCRAAALSLASGEIVAFTEDHCVHPPDWCERILLNFSIRPDLVLLGGAVTNGSTGRIADSMNYWMTFATYAPGQVTASHPCVAQLIVKASAIDRALRPGELEVTLIHRLEQAPGAIYVDPQLNVTHDQSHGFWRTFAVHFHNGRATGGYLLQHVDDRHPSILESLRWGWRVCSAHFCRSDAAFRAGRKPFHVRAGYLTLILPLIIAHGIGAAVGYRKGPGASPHRLR